MDFDDAPTTEFCPIYTDHACPRCLVTHAVPWFPLDDATEAAREFGHEEPTVRAKKGPTR